MRDRRFDGLSTSEALPVVATRPSPLADVRSLHAVRRPSTLSHALLNGVYDMQGRECSSM